jgi:DNA-binding XRE family transcriptional regulator
MSAAQTRGTPTTHSIRLRTEIFDALVADLAATEQDRARLFDMDRTTLYRIRTGRVTPTLEVAMRMAARVGKTVNELFEVTP